CYYGELCEFTISEYSLSFDPSFGQLITVNLPLFKQPFLIKLCFTLVIMMLLLG
ncbi:unnamed protein product, partial [Didymodactylos carnosus]